MNKSGIFALLALASLLTGCSTETAPLTAERRATGAGTAEHFAEAPPDRPGLGTRWGETRRSQVEVTQFARADFDHPLAVAAIYYNTEGGIRAMAGATAWRRSVPLLPNPAGSLVTVELRDQSGRLLPGLIVGDRWFVIGEEGRRYSIVARNRTDFRLEIVLSVDGLDVIDGRPASFRKRGYIIAPHGRLVVEGFRQSTDTVAAFQFSPVRESYANEKYRNTRNVGIIGVAVFNERGTFPFTDREINRRLKANPFPG